MLFCHEFKHSLVYFLHVLIMWQCTEIDKYEVWLAGGCGAGCVSQDTYLLYDKWVISTKYTRACTLLLPLFPSKMKCYIFMLSLLFDKIICCFCLFAIFSSFYHDARISWTSDVSASNECLILPDSTSLLKKFLHCAHSYIYIFTIFFSMHATTWTSSWCRCLGFFLRKEVLL